MQRLLALLAVLVLAAPATAQWSSFHGDERNTGFSSGTEFGANRSIWWEADMPTGTKIQASPIISNGIVIIADDPTDAKVGGVVHAYQANSGKELWNVTFKGSLIATPAIDSTRVYVHDDTGDLRALELTTGLELGKIAIGKSIAPAMIRQSVLFVGNDAGVLKAIDTQTMSEFWNFDVKTIKNVRTVNPTTGAVTCTEPLAADKIQGAPAFYKHPSSTVGEVIFGTVNGYVISLPEGTTTKPEQPRWIYKTGGAITASVAIDTVYHRAIIGSLDGKVYALPVNPSGADGKCYGVHNNPFWTYTVPDEHGDGRVRATAALDGQRVYIGSLSGKMYGLNLQNGAKLWDHDTGSSILASPAASNNIVVVANKGGEIRWLDATDGSQKELARSQGSIEASPAIVGNRTISASFDGRVTVYGPEIPRPDLEITQTIWTSNVLSVRVRNNGPGSSGASTLRVNFDDAFLTDLATPSLTANTDITLTYNLMLDPGVYTFVVTADADDVIAELNEDNNDREYIAEVLLPDE